ncbi:MAG TPA: hypothetical protein VHP81_07005, partial [Lachnospiraceae bacterium]|nr:hypothetical protein [Lachnospiraceae bacterium]
KLMKRVIRILPHSLIILSAMFITFWILDIMNPAMNFINNGISNKLLLLFCILSIINSILTVALDRGFDKYRS